MKNLKISETETIKITEENTDEYGNIALTLDQARKYINYVFNKKIKKSTDSRISKAEIDNFLDFGFEINESKEIPALASDDDFDIVLFIEDGLKYINLMFDKQQNIELETNNDKDDFVFTKQEIDEFADSAIKEIKWKTK